MGIKILFSLKIMIKNHFNLMSISIVVSEDMSFVFFLYNK